MENKKGNLSTVFLVIAIILIVVMGYLLYIQKTEANKQIAELEKNLIEMQEKIDSISSEDKFTNENNAVNVKLGKYNLNEVDYSDPTMPNNEDCGITLKENNEFQIDMGWGAWHSGKYEIKNNQLICTSTLLEWDGGPGAGERETDVIFTFDIINSNKLKLSNIDINDTDDEKLVYEDGLTIGMTYSIK